MAIIKRGGANLEERRKGGADKRRHPRPKPSCRSQFGEKQAESCMTTREPTGELRSGEQR